MGFHHISSLFLLAVTARAAPLAADNSGLIECLKSHSLPILIQSSPNYTAAIQPFNLRVPWKPTALVTPSTTDQIAQAIQCANKYDVKVAARSGGHSYSANGLGGADGSLVIDMKMFKSVNVDPTTQIATIGTGNRLGDIATKLFAQGKRALPHGLCPGLAILPFRGLRASC
jgi:FAD/FMN-containing dehydrogenase